MSSIDPESTSSSAAFISSQAMLCLITLIALAAISVTLAMAARTYLRHEETRTAGLHHVVCNSVLVTFSPDARVDQLNLMLEKLGASIASGPNENGAFELSIAGRDPDAAVAALNRINDVVLIASIQELCTSRH